MKLSLILGPELIVIGLEAADKFQAMEKLVDLLVTRKRIEPGCRDKVLESLKDRERIKSTGMEFGVAIPHCSTDLLPDVVGALGISKGGIPYDGPDAEKKHLLILLHTPRDKFQLHVRTLAGIARLFQNEAFRRELQAANTPEEALKTIEQHEQEG